MRRLVAVVAVLVAMIGSTAGVARSAVTSGAISTIVTGNPLRLTLTLSASQTAAGTSIKAKGTASDLARTNFTDVILTLRVPAGISVSGLVVHDLGPLGAGRTAASSWNVCGTSAGNYLLMLGGTARDASGRTWTMTSDAVRLTLTPGSKGCR